MTDDVMTQLAAARTNPSIIMVVGVGGAGGNAVNHMWNLGICLLYTSPSPRDTR